MDSAQKRSRIVQLQDSARNFIYTAPSKYSWRHFLTCKRARERTDPPVSPTRHRDRKHESRRRRYLETESDDETQAVAPSRSRSVPDLRPVAAPRRRSVVVLDQEQQNRKSRKDSSSSDDTDENAVEQCTSPSSTSKGVNSDNELMSLMDECRALRLENSLLKKQQNLARVKEEILLDMVAQANAEVMLQQKELNRLLLAAASRKSSSSSQSTED